MKNNHRGDSLPKRVARLQFYLNVRALVGVERFTSMRFLYLASFAGGDAAVLGALGVPAEQQLAVDFDPDALRLFSEKFPGVPTHCGDVGELKGHTAFDCVFIDLCSNLSDNSINACVGASRALARGNDRIFGFAIQRGRESGWKGRIEAADRRNRKAAECRGIKLSNSAPANRLNDARSSLIYEPVQLALQKRRIGLLTFFRLAYRGVELSELERGKPGTPMLVVAYRTLSGARDWGWMRFREMMVRAVRENQQFHRDWGERIVSERLGSVVKVNKVGVPASELMGRLLEAQASPALDLVGFEDGAILADTIHLLDRLGVSDVASALNVADGTIAAVRAHDSRGTYDEGRMRLWRKATVSQLEEAEHQGMIRRGTTVIVDSGDPFKDAQQALLVALGDDPKLAAAIRSISREELEATIKAAEGVRP